MFNKKANFSGYWAEYLFIFLIVIGFLISAIIENVLFIYVIAYIIGFHCGILTYINIKKTRAFPIWLIIGGLLIGYLIGSYQAKKFVIIILFVIGIINGHLLLKKNILFFDKRKK